MRLGVLSDVHGNRHALEAVLADGAAQGVDRWWALGDLVAIGPDPVAVLELLADLPDIVVTRGNTERYTLTRDRPPPHAADVLAAPGAPRPLRRRRRARSRGPAARSRPPAGSRGWPSFPSRCARCSPTAPASSASTARPDATTATGSARIDPRTSCAGSSPAPRPTS